MYDIVIAPRALKQLKAITKQNHKIAISIVIDDLKYDPYLGKKLRGYPNRYSYRVGVYRVLYKIYKKEKIVEIVSAGHRAVIYN